MNSVPLFTKIPLFHVYSQIFSNTVEKSVECYSSRDNYCDTQLPNHSHLPLPHQSSTPSYIHTSAFHLPFSPPSLPSNTHPPSSTHPPTQSAPLQPPSPSLIHPPTHLPLHSPFYPLIHSSAHLLLHPSTHPFFHLLIHMRSI
jgi:hypothetical protein